MVLLFAVARNAIVVDIDVADALLVPSSASTAPAAPVALAAVYAATSIVYVIVGAAAAVLAGCWC